MWRKLRNLVALVSLSLFAATALLWARSYFRGDYFSFHTSAGDRLSITSTNGTLLAERQFNEIYYDKTRPQGWTYRTLDPAHYRDRKWTTASQWRFAGFGLVINRGTVARTQKSARPGAWQNTVVLVPYWSLLIILAIPIGLWIRAKTRARRLARMHLCNVCGYDLRATPTRCPECGTVATSGKVSVA